jgi:phage terminase small subunit
MGGKSNKLSEKQRRFVNAYMGECNGNGANAAALAGYKGNRNTLRVIAAENLTKPIIIQEIERLREFDREESVLTRKGRQIWLRKFIRRDDVKDMDKLKALDMLAKMDGDYLERRQVEASVKVDDLRTKAQDRLANPEFWERYEAVSDALLELEADA